MPTCERVDQDGPETTNQNYRMFIFLASFVPASTSQSEILSKLFQDIKKMTIGGGGGQKCGLGFLVPDLRF
jgi:hypothetical protein